MRVWEKGAYKPEDLDTEEPYKKLISETAKVFSPAITDAQMPREMAAYLQRDGHIFSGLKTHAQLKEATALLLDEAGLKRPLGSFKLEVLKLNEAYNVNYLEAEYQFAVHSAQMAAKWAAFEATGDRYQLQYRTANDDRVRASHQPLHNITLPKADDFWRKYFPPNGWRCRCTVVEVRAGKFPESDSGIAAAAGETATTLLDKSGNNKLQIFRFNPGMDKCLMPPDHPLTQVAGAAKAKQVVAKTAPAPPATAKPDPAFKPAQLPTYESTLGISVNPEIFEMLTKDTPLHFTNPNGETKGAFYSPGRNYVVIPLDDRRKNSKWYAEAVTYHEYGHAVDYHHGLQNSKEVKDLMRKYRKEFKKEDDAKYKEIDRKLWSKKIAAHKDGKHDLLEKIGAAQDTLMSLDPNYGIGHKKSYFKEKGKKEAEFIAHCFENHFAENDVFKEVMPELYKEMAALVSDWKATISQPN